MTKEQEEWIKAYVKAPPPFMKRVFEVNIDIDGKTVKYSMDVDEFLVPNIRKNMVEDEDLMQKIRLEMVELTNIMFRGGRIMDETKDLSPKSV